MKKKYLVFGLIGFSSAFGYGQRAINPYPPRAVAKTTIELVYAQYLQNGNHSAITGGKGTEKLQVYSPEINIKHQADSLNSYSFDGGVDIISSASMDNIDFVKSSASKVGARAYVSTGYDRRARSNSGLTFGGKAHFSIESAYLSLGGTLSANAKSKDLSREFQAGLDFYFDDLRWGRLNGERPLQLIYPAELRYKQWFVHYQRRSYNLSLSFIQTINRRLVLALMPGISYQQGLLSTPYHRVFFQDSSLKVENVPGSRIKLPLAVQLNAFIGNRYILRTYYRFYWDDFGILAHTVSLDLAVKLNAALTLTPQIRWYTQTAADFFRPYRETKSDAAFYSSDYDLSEFQSWEPGLEARLALSANRARKLQLNSLGLRYSFYQRSDGLHAHLLSLLVDLETRGKTK